MLLVACGDDDNHNQGRLGGSCYPNGTCNATLTCNGGVCVGELDAAVDSPIEDAAIDATVDAPPDAPDCEPVNASPPLGHHNAGMGCRTAAGCHNAQLGLGTAAPEYSVAGTVYKDMAGTMPYAGATISVTVGGTTKTAIAANDGNFWFVPAQLPAPTTGTTGTTEASACPNTEPMVGLLVSGGGDCNNCHRSGGSAMPVYVLP